MNATARKRLAQIIVYFFISVILFGYTFLFFKISAKLNKLGVNKEIAAHKVC